MKLVIIESPFAGPSQDAILRNVMYARRAMKDAIARGEAPFASHLLYTQEGILDDHIKEERLKGMVCGYNWMLRADLVAFYVDLGWSLGMKAALERVKLIDKPYENRSI